MISRWIFQTLLYVSWPLFCLADAGLSPLSFDQDNALLGQPNFRVEVKVRLISSQSNDIDDEIYLTEHYSNTQRRARLEFHSSGVGRLSNSNSSVHTKYYYHASENQREDQMLKLSHWISGKTECKSVNTGVILDDLFGSLATKNHELSSSVWFSDWGQGIPSHVIGFARLVLLAKQQVANLRRVESSGTLLRNLEVKKYELNINLNSPNSKEGNTNKLMLYFAHSSVHHPQSDFPIRIWAVLASSAEMIIDYSSLEPLHETDFNLEPDNGRDAFAFPVGYKCSENLAPVLSGDDIALSKLRLPKVVSFKAEIYEQYDYIKAILIDDPFVAYDGYLKTMRMESLKERHDAEGRMSSYYTITTYDLKRNLKFHSQQRLDFDSGNDTTQLAASDRGESSGGCVASKIYEDDDDKSARNPFEPIVPFRKLVLMGQGQVRGVDVWIYEMVTNELPALIFAKVNYIDLKGTKVSAFRPAMGSMKLKHDLSIVYYFAKSDDRTTGIYERLSIEQVNLGQLMQVDVFKDNQYLVYRVNVHQFLWRLTEAPNGDKASELFSLEKDCFSGVSDTRQDQSGKLAMELEYSSDDQQTIGYVTETSELFSSPLTRNKALLRSLTDTSSKLYATQVFELESRLKVAGDGYRFSIGLDAKLSDLRPIVYRATSMSLGSVKDSTKRTGATTFDECYWQAAHRTAHFERSVLFSFCLGACVISNSPETNSNVFTLGLKSLPCDILQLDLVSSDKRLANWLPVYKNLKGNVLSIPIQKDDAPDGDTREVSMNVKHLQVTSDNWINLANGTETNEVATLQPIKGYAFVPLVGNDAETTRPITRSSNRDHSNDPVDLRHCHSKCVADLNCKSFSICVTGQSIECMSSVVNVRNITVLNNIQHQTEELTRNGKPARGSTIEIINAIGKGDSLVNFKLKLDNRCQIYPKVATEMFTKTPKLVMSNVIIKNIVPASSVEECAELCLQKSVKFFKRSAGRKLDYLKSDDNNNEEKLIALMVDNFKYFCSRFKFYNLLTNDVTKETMDSLKESKLENMTSVCVLARPNSPVRAYLPLSSASNATATKSQPIKLKMEAFDFKYEMLFEKQYNLYLREGRFSDQLGRELINKQVVALNQPNPDICARKCFLQQIDDLSWCKSFEFVEDRSEILSFTSKQLKTYCIFNTISLAEAKAHENLWESQDGLQNRVTYWHFEPIDAYTLDSKIWSRLLKNPKGPERKRGDVLGSVRLGAFGILIVLAVSVVSGVALGNHLGLRLPIESIGARTVRSSSIASQSESILNSIVVADESTLNSNTFELDANVATRGNG